MKKILAILIPVVLNAGFSVYKIAANATTQPKLGGLMDKKVLVAYFSWSGNTKSVAEKIHSQVGGDIFKIEPVTPYPSDYNETAYGIAKEQKDKGIHPPIKNTDVSSYDVIFVGTPAWWYTMAPPVMTFLSENNFEGKTIVPFVTHGGGGGYTIDKDMANLAKGAKVLSPFVVYGKGGASVDKDLAEWINKL
mgnify:FL=1